MPEKSLIDDFAAIAQRLREIEGPARAKEPSCFACSDMGWQAYGLGEWRICYVCQNIRGLPHP